MFYRPVAPPTVLSSASSYPSLGLGAPTYKTEHHDGKAYGQRWIWKFRSLSQSLWKPQLSKQLAWRLCQLQLNGAMHGRDKLTSFTRTVRHDSC